jgi:hypothetical protein
MSLSPDTESLFSAARGAMEQPGEGDRARNLAAVLAKVGAGTGAAGAALTVSGKASGSVAGATKAGSLAAMKVLVALTLTAAVGTTAVFAVRSATSASTSPAVVSATAPETRRATAAAPVKEGPAKEDVASPVPVMSIDEIPTVAAEPPPVEKTSRARVLAPRSTPAEETAPPADRSAHLRDEVLLVAKIHEAQRAGDNPRVFALVQEHARAFPDGVLYEECRASEAMAFCATAAKADASARADAFKTQYPASPLLPRVTAACEK